MGVEPEQVQDLKGLAGDSSDNIKGVNGVGPKTAVQLIKKFGSVENIYQHLAELPEKLRQKMADGFEAACQSKHLVTIVTDVPLTLDLPACRVSDYNQKQAVALFEELGFKSLIKKLPKEAHESCFSPRLFA